MVDDLFLCIWLDFLITMHLVPEVHIYFILPQICIYLYDVLSLSRLREKLEAAKTVQPHLDKVLMICGEVLWFFHLSIKCV